MRKRAILLVVVLAIVVAGCAGGAVTAETPDIADEPARPTEPPVFARAEPPPPREPREPRLNEPEELEELEPLEPEEPEVEPEIFWTQGTGYGYALAWRVLPELEYETIFHCLCGGFFSNNDWYFIDRATGFLTKQMHGGHGGWKNAWRAYDQERGLFGFPGGALGPSRTNTFYPLGEFEKHVINNELLGDWFLEWWREFLAVESVDSSLVERYESEWEAFDMLTREAFLGRYALMYNLEFVTDFIFDEVAPPWNHTGPARWQGNWGVINREGYTVVPFVFEHILLIDEHTAFAKYGGAYGILDLRHTLEALQNQ